MSVRVVLVALLLALALVPPAVAGPPAPTQEAKSAPTAPRKVVTIEGITEYVLDNGLRVLLFSDQTKPTFTVNITYFVGSRHEGYGETGMAHLLEHMVFKGTPTVGDVWGALEDHGAFFNGTTWVDRTNYFETLPATPENLEFLDDIAIENNQCREQANIYSQVLAGLMDARASIVGNNLNMLMKTLNVITIAIMVPTFVVSAFSMNVRIPMAGWSWAFYMVMGLAAASMGLVVLMWRHRW